MKSKQGIILAVCVLILVALWWFQRDSRPSPEVLAKRALSAPKLEDKVKAAIQLAMYKDSVAVPSLRHVAAETKDAEVLAPTINGLGYFNDTESLLLFFTLMNHDAEAVRAAAYDSALKVCGGNLPEKIDYGPEDSPEDRAKVTARLEKIYKEGKEKPLPGTKSPEGTPK